MIKSFGCQLLGGPSLHWGNFLGPNLGVWFETNFLGSKLGVLFETNFLGPNLGVLFERNLSVVTNEVFCLKRMRLGIWGWNLRQTPEWAFVVRHLAFGLVDRPTWLNCIWILIFQHTKEKNIAGSPRFWPSWSPYLTYLNFDFYLLTDKYKKIQMSLRRASPCFWQRPSLH